MRTEVKVNLKQTQNMKKIWQRKNLKNEPQLRQYLVLAHQIKDVLDKNPSRTLREIAGWLGFSPPRLSQILNLLYLSPSIQEDILLADTKKIKDVTINTANLIAQELSWEKQKDMWGTQNK
jgi:hypothetical protein